mmetsp:Transcript_14705/g.49456  ORF Transcript_14705/g.49456 Transcript_14705/m.49456 type:complete len:241 (+) Transcript_14705:1304-2026(+)
MQQQLPLRLDGEQRARLSAAARDLLACGTGRRAVPAEQWLDASDKRPGVRCAQAGQRGVQLLRQCEEGLAVREQPARRLQLDHTVQGRQPSRRVERRRPSARGGEGGEQRGPGGEALQPGDGGGRQHELRRQRGLALVGGGQQPGSNLRLLGVRDGGFSGPALVPAAADRRLEAEHREQPLRAAASRRRTLVHAEQRRRVARRRLPCCKRRLVRHAHSRVGRKRASQRLEEVVRRALVHS